eukprot:GFYU01025826.1.p1 GENE.GFYU01025826.1~~GFYU01025826.1.p1  ORF type:complete len:217 (+),score=42.16 GFYU01025826.1:70-651(+)
MYEYVTSGLDTDCKICFEFVPVRFDGVEGEKLRLYASDHPMPAHPDFDAALHNTKAQYNDTSSATFEVATSESTVITTPEGSTALDAYDEPSLVYDATLTVTPLALLLHTSQQRRKLSYESVQCQVDHKDKRCLHLLIGATPASRTCHTLFFQTVTARDSCACLLDDARKLSLKSGSPSRVGRIWSRVKNGFK